MPVDQHLAVLLPVSTVLPLGEVSHVLTFLASQDPVSVKPKEEEKGWWAQRCPVAEADAMGYKALVCKQTCAATLAHLLAVPLFYGPSVHSMSQAPCVPLLCLVMGEYLCIVGLL